MAEKTPCSCATVCASFIAETTATLIIEAEEIEHALA